MNRNGVLYFVFVNLFVCVFSHSIELYEGDDCEISYNEKGICVRLSLCPSAIEIIQQKEHPKKCGFVRSIPIVCCAKTQVKITRLADQKCQLFQNADSGKTLKNKPVIGTLLPNNARENNDRQIPPLEHKPSRTLIKRQAEEDAEISHIFVIGGEDAVEREFPHMAALGYTSNNRKLWLCGGSLISEQYVLTAAHCLFSKDFGPLQWVRLGELNLDSSIDRFVAEDYRVTKTIAHPLYQAPSVYHDIALVQLEREIIITTKIKPACLFTQENIPNNVELLATGWGLTNVGGKQSDVLQKVDLELFTENECDGTYRSIAKTRRLKNGILHAQQICVGARSEEKDTCQGDSGGPLQIKINDANGDRFYIVGVTSFGRSCGIPNVPGIYTRVSYYLPWIESVLWDNEKY